MTARPQFGRKAYALAAIGLIAFTLYGSYVPFEFRARPWREIWSSFEWAMRNRIAFESRSDGLANWLLGFPLGFCMLGALRVDRPNGLVTAILGGLLVPICTLFAAAVELGQLYFPARTCSGSDVIAQGLGSLCGILLWVMAGPSMTNQLRRIFEGGQADAAAIRFTIGYAAFIALVQWLPLDFTVSPADLYRRLFREEYRVTYLPFEEIRNSAYRGGVDVWDKIQAWLELAMLFLPLGMILALIRNRRKRSLVFVALAFALFTEIGQVTVARHPSTTDALIAFVATMFGWLTVSLSAHPTILRLRREIALILGQVWLFAMFFIHWHPFRFIPARFTVRFEDLEWWPLAAQASENYLWALDKVFMKFAIFVPCGILCYWGSGWSSSTRTNALAALVSGSVAALLEAGQMLLPGRYASPTDVAFGVFGGWFGAAVARQILAATVREAASGERGSAPVGAQYA